MNVSDLRARRNAPLAEKVEQKLGGFFGQNSARGIDPVVELGTERPQGLEAADRPDLEVGRAENESRHARRGLRSPGT